MRMLEATNAQKLLLSQKKLLNAILEQSFKYMKHFLSNEMNMFFCHAKTDFHCVEFFAEKSFRA